MSLILMQKNGLNLKAGKENKMSNAKCKKLSKRELEVKKLLLIGLSRKQIATRLFISESTAKRHVTNIYHKEGVQSRFELLLKNIKSVLTVKNIFSKEV